ncbi:cytochrome b5-related protein-like [Neodiprion virginianus]|uniref:cytochrome b5-related protein-like n=1 Tax=Neodiprion virginianus TaxID=2961670 RepID=UPI001EE6D2A7|nr:cytochrome b5-related protein-like [Neodiprion virginianus]
MTDTEDSRNEKRQDDGAEGLWPIGDEIYDLDGWATNHPDGSEWITLIQGTDITEAFEVFSDLEPFRSFLEFSNLAIFTSIPFLSQAHHVTLLAERLLPEFYVREATTPRSCPFTFKSDGFYRIFEERAREAQKHVDFHNPTKTWNRNSYMTRSSPQTPRFSGVLLTWTSITGNNFMHQGDFFCMYFMDLLLQTSREWRINRGLSHHLFTKTVQDMQIAAFEQLIF